jgi:hypothetical protein
MEEKGRRLVLLEFNFPVAQTQDGALFLDWD